MIPRRVFWFLDLITIGLVFLVAYRCAAILQPMLMPGGSLWFQWIQRLSPPVIEGMPFPSLSDFLWVLLAGAPSAILFLEIFKNYEPVIEKSRLRLMA